MRLCYNIVACFLQKDHTLFTAYHLAKSFRVGQGAKLHYLTLPYLLYSAG